MKPSALDCNPAFERPLAPGHRAPSIFCAVDSVARYSCKSRHKYKIATGDGEGRAATCIAAASDGNCAVKQNKAPAHCLLRSFHSFLVHPRCCAAARSFWSMYCHFRSRTVSSFGGALMRVPMYMAAAGSRACSNKTSLCNLYEENTCTNVCTSTCCGIRRGRGGYLRNPACTPVGRLWGWHSQATRRR